VADAKAEYSLVITLDMTIKNCYEDVHRGFDVWQNHTDRIATGIGRPPQE